MLRQRLEIANCVCHCLWRSDLWLYPPLLAYQDVIALAIIAWISYGLFMLARNPRVCGGLTRTGWYFLLLLTFYTSIDTVIFSYIHTEATYKLFVLSGQPADGGKVDLDALGGDGPYLELGNRFDVRAGRREPALRARFAGFDEILFALWLALIAVYAIDSPRVAARYLSYPPTARNGMGARVAAVSAPPKVPYRFRTAYLDDFCPRESGH